jgi:hypothetical protein
MEKKFLIFSKRARKNLRILAYVDKIGMVYFSVSPHPCGGGFEKQGSEPGAKATGGFSFGRIASRQTLWRSRIAKADCAFC